MVRLDDPLDLERTAHSVLVKPVEHPDGDRPGISFFPFCSTGGYKPSQGSRASFATHGVSGERSAPWDSNHESLQAPLTAPSLCALRDSRPQVFPKNIGLPVFRESDWASAIFPLNERSAPIWFSAFRFPLSYTPPHAYYA